MTYEDIGSYGKTRIKNRLLFITVHQTLSLIRATLRKITLRENKLISNWDDKKSAAKSS